MSNLTVISKLAKARSEFELIEKDTLVNTGKYKYNYATLDGIMRAVSPALCRNGLYVWNTQEETADTITITAHVSDGESSLESSISLPLTQVNTAANPVQAKGSVLTYGRRYSIQALLGITAAEEDNDAAVPAQRPREPLSESKALPIEQKLIKKAEDNIFDSSDNAWAWLDNQCISHNLSSESKAVMRAFAPGKTAGRILEYLKTIAKEVEHVSNS